MRLHALIATSVATLGLVSFVTVPASEAVAAQMAADHEAMAKVYGSHKGKMPSQMVHHCTNLADQYRNAAKEYRALAAEYREVAKSAGK